MTLPPINHEEDIEKFGAHHESKPVEFQGCKHTNIQFNKERHELRCLCGIAFTGPRLHELERLLKGIDKI